VHVREDLRQLMAATFGGRFRMRKERPPAGPVDAVALKLGEIDGQDIRLQEALAAD